MRVSKLFLIFSATVTLAAEVQAQHRSAVECLYDSIFVSIKPDYEADVVIKQKYRFNGPDGSEYSVIREPVNRYVDFALIEASYLTSESHRTSLRQEDVETVSDFGPYYYRDSKTKVIRLPAARAGMVAEIAYRLKYKSLLYLPQFVRQRDILTRNSYLEVLSYVPYAYHVTGEWLVRDTKGSRLVLRADSLPAVQVEANMPPPDVARIVIRPDTVVYDGKKYGLMTWADVAAFYNDLAAERSIPDRDINLLARTLCFGAQDLADSLRALSEFIHDNIRYVSAEVGRDEFRPLYASDVRNKKYGDCKDQTALMVALCRAVGIRASPVLISTKDRHEAISSLPWPGYFNHVVTAIITGNGYLFLDPSQPTCCFGYLPAKLRQRQALVCTTQPVAELTQTSSFDRDNRLDFNLIYSIDAAGGFRCDITLKFFGDPAFDYLSNSPELAVGKVLASFLNGNPISNHTYSFRADSSSSNYLEISGRFFGELPKAPGSGRLLMKAQSPFIDYLRNYFQGAGRNAPYSFDYGFSMRETVTLDLSEGPWRPGDFRVEDDSLVIAFDEPGIEARLSLKSNNAHFSINKEFKLFDHTLSADRYNRFVSFLLAASQAPYNSIEIMSKELEQ